MCAPHWRKVPQKLRLAVWLAYRPGQCDDKRPSAEWFAAADAAIRAVAEIERDEHARERACTGDGEQLMLPVRRSP